jgi:hypothetical protein
MYAGRRHAPLVYTGAYRVLLSRIYDVYDAIEAKKVYELKASSILLLIKLRLLVLSQLPFSQINYAQY